MKITHAQLTKLKKLKEKADELQKQVDKLFLEALAITQEKDLGGHTFDYIWNNFEDLDTLVKRLELEVSD